MQSGSRQIFKIKGKCRQIISVKKIKTELQIVLILMRRLIRIYTGCTVSGLVLGGEKVKIKQLKLVISNIDNSNSA